MLQALLKRFDETTLASDKQREAQIAFNTQVSADLAHIRKQLDLTQADIDEVRQQQRELPPSPPAAERHCPNTADHHDDDTQASAVTSLEHDRGARPQGPAVRLANNGPPLLPTRHALSYAGVGQTNALVAGRDAHTGQREECTVKPPKHDFPHFDGDAPSLWIDRCITYFDLYRVPPHSWVTTASLYIDGHAAHWYQAYRQTHRSPSWQEFTAAIITEFAPDEFEMEMHKFAATTPNRHRRRVPDGVRDPHVPFARPRCVAQPQAVHHPIPAGLARRVTGCSLPSGAIKHHACGGVGPDH